MAKDETTTSYITSIKHPLVEQARLLATPKGRREQGRCLLEGQEHIEWAIQEGLLIEHVLFDNTLLEHSLFAQLKLQNIPCYATSQGVLKKISETNYVIPFIGVARLRKEQFSQDGHDFILVLDHLKDHGNIGTIVRSARAFDLMNIVLIDDNIDIFYKKMIDASRGKVFGAHVVRYQSSTSALSDLKNAGYHIVATSPRGSTLQSLVALSRKPIALFVGNETQGLSDDVLQNADYVIQIPMSSDVESLNVAVAAGISIYELKMKMVLAMLQEKIKSSLGRNLNVAAKLIQNVFEEQTKNLTGYSNLQVILLMILKCDQFMTYQQVSKDTATFGSELDALLNPLFKNLLIQKIQKNNIDGIELTYKGDEFLAKIWLMHEKNEKEILADFSEVEIQQLDNFLQRIQENCQKIITK